MTRNLGGGLEGELRFFVRRTTSPVGQLHRLDDFGWVFGLLRTAWNCLEWFEGQEMLYKASIAGSALGEHLSMATALLTVTILFTNEEAFDEQ